MIRSYICFIRRILRQLEDLVHGIIYQVEDVLASSAGRATVGRKIAIELADRKKPLKSDGRVTSIVYAFILTFLCQNLQHTDYIVPP